MTSPHEQALAAATAAIQEVHFDSYGLTREIAEAAITAYLAALPAPDLAEWEKAAEGVTRGEWAVDGFNLAGVISRAPGRTHVSDWKHLAVCGNENSNWRKDAAWIARCSPDNVMSAFRSLTAKLAAVERERDTLTERLAEMEAGR